jgi:hypothetical protein
MPSPQVAVHRAAPFWQHFLQLIWVLRQSWRPAEYMTFAARMHSFLPMPVQPDFCT